MAERSCRPAFSLPFHSLIVARQVDFSDEVPDQFDFLPAVAAGFVRRIDDDLFYKLIDDGGRQFQDAHILPHNGFRANEPHYFVIERFRPTTGCMYFIDCPAEPVTDGFLQRISPFWQIIALFGASFSFHSVPVLSGEVTTEQA